MGITATEGTGRPLGNALRKSKLGLLLFFFNSYFKDFIFFLERGEGREKDRESVGL